MSARMTRYKKPTSTMAWQLLQHPTTLLAFIFLLGPHRLGHSQIHTDTLQTYQLPESGNESDMGIEPETDTPGHTTTTLQDEEEESLFSDNITEPPRRIRHHHGDWTRDRDQLKKYHDLVMDGHVPSDEKRLTSHLHERYRRLGVGGRPLSNSSQAVLVRFGLAMIQMDLDEKNNMLTTSVWCRYRWYDEYLSWNPQKYGGLKKIRLSTKMIWIPDIMLYNTADTHKLEREVLAVISYEGNVLWIPHRIYRSSCSVDVTNYPFDRQECRMTFGSWAYHGNEIDLGFHKNLEMLDISDLERESTEWDITAKTEDRIIEYYDCCPEPYVLLVFTLKLKRKLVFSSFILTLPCIFLACMTLVVFWLPPERPDRTSLAMSLFSSFLLLLLILVEAAPPTASSVPTLGLYYCFNMVIIMLSIFLSSVIINVSRKGESAKRLPNWVRMIALEGLGRFFCTKLKFNRREILRARPNKRHSETVEDGKIQVIANEEAMTTGNIANGVTPETLSIKDLPSEITLDSHTFKLLNGHFLLMEKYLRYIEQGINSTIDILKEKEITREIRRLRIEWQLVAMTMDRLFFVIFVVAIVISLVLLFPRPYQFQDNSLDELIPGT